MVVVPEPAVKGAGAFLACAVDGAVGPAVDQGADEAFGFAVCLGAARAGAEMMDAELAAGECVDRRDVGAAVVGEDSLDGDPVAAVVGGGAAKEADRGRCFLVSEHLGICEPAVVVDRDVGRTPSR